MTVEDPQDSNNSSNNSSNSTSNNSDSNSANSTSSNPSFPASTLPPLDDTLIFCSLIILALLFLYSFIKYLKAGLKPPEDDDISKGIVSDRRFRFGRLRRNSGNKVWLDPLDPQDPFDPQDLDPVLHLDADRLIQSDLSPESVMKELDPMGVLTTPDQLSSSNTLKCQVYEWVGIGLAGAISIIFIVIFSNFEE